MLRIPVLGGVYVAGGSVVDTHLFRDRVAGLYLIGSDVVRIGRGNTKLFIAHCRANARVSMAILSSLPKFTLLLLYPALPSLQSYFSPRYCRIGKELIEVASNITWRARRAFLIYLK